MNQRASSPAAWKTPTLARSDHHHLPPWSRWPVVAGTAGETQNINNASLGLTAAREKEKSTRSGPSSPTLRDYHEARRLTRKREEVVAVTALPVAGKQQYEEEEGCRYFLFATAGGGWLEIAGKLEEVARCGWSGRKVGKLRSFEDAIAVCEIVDKASCGGVSMVNSKGRPERNVGVSLEEANAPMAFEVAESDSKQQTTIIGGGVEDVYGEDGCTGDHFITHWSVSVVRQNCIIGPYGMSKFATLVQNEFH
ncbi:hypothetical protein LXL04_029506 [Taraxacum kok-saghyz]